MIVMMHRKMFFFFLIPNHVLVGRILGLTIVIGNFIFHLISAFTMILNVGLLIIRFLFIRREFGGKTVYTSIMFPMIIGIFEKVYSDYTSINEDLLLNMVCYVFVHNIGISMLSNRNDSSGGLGIVEYPERKYGRPSNWNDSWLSIYHTVHYCFLLWIKFDILFSHRYTGNNM